MTDMNPRAK